MTGQFDYREVAEEVLEKHGQDAGFSQRFLTFCQNAMEGKAEDADLARLIENVTLEENEHLDES